ncbi:MAG: hypothetical protein NTX29_10295, partial [Actinobacteria bacterium]|nr:hypothetical protein [Actinomycetota bacterium]
MTPTRSRASVAMLAALLVLGTPLLAACGGVAQSVAEKAAEQAVGGNVDITDDGVTVTDDQGNEVAMGTDVSLPDTWPAEIPVFDGGTLSMVSVQDDGSASAMWLTDATPQEATDTYAAALDAAGYTQSQTSNMGGMIVSEYTGNGYTVSLNSIEADGQTTLMLSAT